MGIKQSSSAIIIKKASQTKEIPPPPMSSPIKAPQTKVYQTTPLLEAEQPEKEVTSTLVENMEATMKSKTNQKKTVFERLYSLHEEEMIRRAMKENFQQNQPAQEKQIIPHQESPNAHHYENTEIFDKLYRDAELLRRSKDQHCMEVIESENKLHHPTIDPISEFYARNGGIRTSTLKAFKDGECIARKQEPKPQEEIAYAFKPTITYHPSQYQDEETIDPLMESSNSTAFPTDTPPSVNRHIHEQENKVPRWLRLYEYRWTQEQLKKKKEAEIRAMEDSVMQPPTLLASSVTNELIPPSSTQMSRAELWLEQKQKKEDELRQKLLEEERSTIQLKPSIKDKIDHPSQTFEEFVQTTTGVSKFLSRCELARKMKEEKPVPGENSVFPRPPTQPKEFNFSRKVEVKSLQRLVSLEKRRYVDKELDVDLDLACLIIAMGYPSESFEAMYRNPMTDVKKFLNFRHKDHYRVYNLCCEPDRQYDHSHFEGRVGCYPFADHNCPPFEMIEEFCLDCDQYMKQDPKNVCVIHCKAGKGRTGLMICCLLLYMKEWENAEEAMEFYGIARTKNRKGVTIPSQRRYIHYFERHLWNPHSVPILQPLTLVRIRMTPPPVYKKDRCKPTYVIEQNGRVLLDYEKQIEGKLVKYPKTVAYVEMEGFNCCFDGDVRFRFTHKEITICQFWINTRFVTTNPLVLTQKELDKAISDKKNKHIPKGFTLALFFEETEMTRVPKEVEEWERRRAEREMQKELEWKQKREERRRRKREGIIGNEEDDEEDLPTDSEEEEEEEEEDDTDEKDTQKPKEKQRSDSVFNPFAFAHASSTTTSSSSASASSSFPVSPKTSPVAPPPPRRMDTPPPPSDTPPPPSDSEESDSDEGEGEGGERGEKRKSAEREGSPPPPPPPTSSNSSFAAAAADSSQVTTLSSPTAKRPEPVSPALVASPTSSSSSSTPQSSSSPPPPPPQTLPQEPSPPPADDLPSPPLLSPSPEELPDIDLPPPPDLGTPTPPPENSASQSPYPFTPPPVDPPTPPAPPAI
ncbi:putative pten protein [Monocercomonoides exilis]|uniref:putative pten protein n=1 Tax=Monocercomonoides exilis TaxID=2049356 RepID=UPI003559FF01|nr:putative pten protein [Monocercomonoides exilis]|eukprot:MONOS_11573.1-p1 / transcript=MONOS_11573.1 / gene=MONOS_11573 / organism=Monocercomonoides_exilis_PA203 / gene_product=mammalian PTEN tumor suppressorlike, putative / transcript_product=mammalian PTEN tumor suppressorlike, putative / location=Mono_scaffold00588:6459-11693(-) / protein_length=1029 / sequence_SO=supercontig / SO=protein_coding / is_pseudo=false